MNKWFNEFDKFIYILFFLEIKILSHRYLPSILITAFSNYRVIYAYTVIRITINYFLLFGKRKKFFFFYILNNQCSVLIIIFCINYWILLTKKKSSSLIKYHLTFLLVSRHLYHITRFYVSFIYLFFFFCKDLEIALENFFQKFRGFYFRKLWKLLLFLFISFDEKKIILWK